MSKDSCSIGNSCVDMEEVRMIDKVISRLTSRVRLRSTAQIFFLSAGEFSSLGICELGPQQPACDDKTAAGSALFVCGPPPVPGTKAGHDCPDSFECASPLHTFTRCQGNDNSAVDCAWNPTPGNFDCSADSKTKFFDCRHFNCAETDDKASFNCQKVLDFLCSARAFECYQDFKCEAKHYFECVDGHACNDVFQCSGGNGTVEDCLKLTPPYKCTGDAGSAGYAQGVGGNDKIPGDFYCGITTDKSLDVFNCLSAFTCKADDDFRCNVTATFLCGHPTNKTTFECKTGSKDDEGFGCSTKFDCGKDPSGAGFKCDKNSSYKCLKNGQLAEYDCVLPPKGVYNCFGSFNVTVEDPPPSE